MLSDIIRRAKEACPACNAEFGVHKYMPRNVAGAEQLQADFGHDNILLVHFDFTEGISTCFSEAILKEAMNGIDEKYNPIFMDGFDEAFYAEEEEEEDPKDEDLPL